MGLLASAQPTCCQRRALESAVPTAPDSAPYLSNLGVALVRRHEAEGNRDDLADALAVLKAALVMTPNASPLRTGRAANLGGALLDLHALDADAVLLTRAIELCRGALGGCPTYAPVARDRGAEPSFSRD